MGCLYRITFPNAKSYIGITASSAKERFAEHCYNSESKRADRAINRAINKYGKESAKLETLVIADWNYLVSLEKKAIHAFNTFGRGGYNMTAGGEGSLGYKHTADSLKKMGDTHRGNSYRKGKIFSAESRRKMSLSALGKVLSAETKAKIGAASKGNSYALGRKLSDQEKKERSISQRGIGKGSSSGHIGVSKSGDAWRAHITVNRKAIHLGRFKTIEEAIVARASGEAHYFGSGDL